MFNNFNAVLSKMLRAQEEHVLLVCNAVHLGEILDFKRNVCRADHTTPLYPQKLALTSRTIGGRSVDIVRLRTDVI
jgi:hypothetical protein